MSKRGDGVNIRFILFLSLGIERSSSPADRPDNNSENWDILSEPSGSRICRRNILALGCMLVLAGLGGVDPHHLSVFGLKFSGGRGVYVLGMAAIFAQFYWYLMRYHHLREDGALLVPSSINDELPSERKLWDYKFIERKSADLWANRAAAFITLLSWVIIAKWLCGPHILPS